MAYVPNSGSVVAFQSNPSSLLVGASIIGLTPVSVSNFPVASGSVVAFQGTNPWIITGSVQAAITPAGNQSVSGTVGASIIGAVPVNIQSSVATVIIGGSIAASFTPAANQSVSGTVGASLIGLSPVSVSNFPTTQNVSGSVVAFQGAAPWVNTNVGSIITVSQGSIAAVIIGGSIAASFTPPANQSVSGTVGASLIGLSPVSVSNFPANQSVSGTVSVTTTDVAPATQNITVIDSSSSTAVGANGQSIIIGTPTAGSAASFAISGVSTVRVEVTGIWTGTIASEQSIDGGTTWTSQGLHQGAYTTSSWTAGFIGGGNVAGATNFRIRATAAITGTAVVKITESVNEQSMYIANAAPAGTIISLLNSTTATLTSGSTFTGTGEDVSNFSEMRISVFADQASATDGLSIQQSTNNTNWDIVDTYTIPASTGKTFVVPRQARYYRMVYTNGGTNQGAFRLQSILNRTATAPSSNRASDGYTNETDLVQNQTFNMVYNGSTWDRARGNTTQGTQVFGSVSAAVSGSVISFQGGAWAHTNIGSVITLSQGSVATVIIGGSIAASFTPPANQSVSGTVNIGTGGPVSVLGTMSVLGTVPVTQATTPWVIGSVYGNFGGSVVSFQGGTQITSLVSTVPSSVIVGASIFGQLPAGTAPLGSVATLQGTNPWIVVGSVYGNISGSVVGFQGGTQITSISGVAYAEDSGHADGNQGLFTFGVRNDTVASFVSANLDYSPIGVDSAGRNLMKPYAPEEARVEGYASLVSTSVTTLVAAPGAGLRNYITDFMVSNSGATTAVITWRSQGGTSVLGYTIAPAGGGSNGIGFNMPIRTGVNETFDFQPNVSSSVLFVTVKGFKAP